MHPQLIQCPWCGAPLPASAGDHTVPCEFCGSRVSVGPDGATSLEGQRTVGSSVWRLLGRRSSLVFGALTGLVGSILASTLLEPCASPIGPMVEVGVLAGVMALAGRRIAAALLCLAAGAAVLGRLFGAPILYGSPPEALSPTSETGFHYLFPGLIALVLAGLLAYRFRLGAWRAGLRALIPRPGTMLAFLLAAALPLWPAWTGTSIAAAQRRHQAAVAQRLAMLQQIARLIEGDLVLPEKALSLSPKPTLLHRGAGNTDIAPRSEVRHPLRGGSPPYGLTFATPSFVVLHCEWSRHCGRWSAHLTDGRRLDAEIRDGLVKRYLAVYWPSTALDERDARAAAVKTYHVVLLDQTSGTGILRLTVPGGDWGRSRTAMMLALQEATGGRFDE